MAASPHLFLPPSLGTTPMATHPQVHPSDAWSDWDPDNQIILQPKWKLRPITRNPFAPSTSLLPNNSPSTNDAWSDTAGLLSDKQQHSNIEPSCQPPPWLILFHDLAWTATFASLNQNWAPQDIWTIVSYTVFFTTVWWIWFTEVLYIVNYYTDDWMNILFVFLQFIGFILLAATTKDFNVTAFILHTPGQDELIEIDESTMTAKDYQALSVAWGSISIITLTIAGLRALMFLKQVRVALYAKLTPNFKFTCNQYLTLPISLVMSCALFCSAYVSASSAANAMTGLASDLKRSAQTVWILWGIAVMVELVSYLQHYGFGKNRLHIKDPASVVERFGGIVIIIISEGVNALASSVWKICQIKVSGATTAQNLFCCVFIVFLLAYLYFEGPLDAPERVVGKRSCIWSGDEGPHTGAKANSTAPSRQQSVGRKISWCLMHLPFLLSVILLLHAMKSQVFLQSFFDARAYYSTGLERALDHSAPLSSGFKDSFSVTLLDSGAVWQEEWPKFSELLARQGNPPENTTSWQEVFDVWLAREELEMITRTYKTFLGDNIPNAIENTIVQYLNTYNFTLTDVRAPAGEPLPVLEDIVNELLTSDLLQTRFIMALCGSTFIWLAALSLLRSWPQDKLQWSAIVSRLTIGAVMCLLVLLGIGNVPKYMPPGHSTGWAPLFAFLESAMVLPTIAMAYVTQFLIDLGLLWLSGRSFTRRDNQFSRVRKYILREIISPVRRALC